MKSYLEIFELEVEDIVTDSTDKVPHPDIDDNPDRLPWA